MEEKEKIYNEIKIRVFYLLENKLLTQSQSDYLLLIARRELGLLTLNKSIYL